MVPSSSTSSRLSSDGSQLESETTRYKRLIRRSERERRNVISSSPADRQANIECMHNAGLTAPSSKLN